MKLPIHWEKEEEEVRSTPKVINEKIEHLHQNVFHFELIITLPLSLTLLVFSVLISGTNCREGDISSTD